MRRWRRVGIHAAMYVVLAAALGFAATDLGAAPRAEAVGEPIPTSCRADVTIGQPKDEQPDPDPGVDGLVRDKVKTVSYQASAVLHHCEGDPAVTGGRTSGVAVMTGTCRGADGYGPASVTWSNGETSSGQVTITIRFTGIGGPEIRENFTGVSGRYAGASGHGFGIGDPTSYAACLAADKPVTGGTGTGWARLGRG
ncbi:hypothetical protein [Allokutzneria oryzae]|uniref:Ig-like domain-containing protein n=1 Tax=Allokutzneria oryzae TaxID=1378989 RepID=A0ABV5ZXE7_9PSEU